MNSERKSLAAFTLTAALLLSSLPMLFAAPLASTVPGAASLSNAGTAAAATTIVTATPSSVLNNVATPITVTGSGYGAFQFITVTVDLPTPTGTVTNAVPIVSDANGAFTATSAVTVPAFTPMGTYTVTAMDIPAQGHVATTSLTVGASIGTVVATPSTVANNVSTSIMVTGTGFAPNQFITVTLALPTGTVTNTASLVSDANGAFTATAAVAVPAMTAPGTYTVTAMDIPQQGHVGTALVTVTGPGLTASTTSVTNDVANTINVTGTAFSPNQFVTVTLTGPGGTFTNTGSIVSNGSGGFTGSLVVPAGAAPGTYVLTAKDVPGLAQSLNVTVAAPGTTPTSTSTSTSTSTATATGTPPTATSTSVPPTPTATVGPPVATLQLSATTGVPLEIVAITGTNFNANATVTISFQGANNAAPFQINTATSNGSGTFSTNIQIPPGTTPVTATITASDGVHSAAASFVVLTPTVSFAGQTGPGGTFVQGVSGSGYAANTAISVTLVPTGTTSAVVTNTGNLVSSSTGTFSLGSTALQVPIGTAPGVYQVRAVDATGLAASSTGAFTVTSIGTATSGTFLGLVALNAAGNVNACTPPSGASIAVVGNAYGDTGAVATGVPTDTVSAIVSGASFVNGETVNFIANNSTLASGVFNTAAGALGVTFSLTATQLAPGMYTLSAVGSTSGSIATAVFAVCAPSISLSTSTATAGSPVTVTGSGFAASEQVSGTVYAAGTTPVTPTAPGVTQAFTAATNSAGQFTAVMTPTSFGTFTLKATGVETTTTAQANDLVTTTTFTVGAGTFITVTPLSVYPTQGFTVTASGGFPAGSTVSLTTTNGISATATVSSTGGFVAPLTAPANTPTGPLTVWIGSSIGTVTTTVDITVPTAAITATPNSAALGQTTSVTGTGFIPNQPVSVSLQFFADGVMAPAGGNVVTATADATGMISTSLLISPSVQLVGGGGYQIVAVSTASSQNMATTPFTVTGFPSVLPGPGGVSPTTPTTLYFAEGYTGRFATNGKADFDEYISVLNPDNFAKTVTFTYQIQGGSPVVTSTTVGANSDILELVNGDVGNDKIVAATVSSNGRIAAERVINRTAPSGKLDSDSSLGNTAPGTTWYFAEGYTGISFQEYLVVQNPGTAPAAVTVTFLPQSTPAATPRTVSFSVPATGRWTENIRRDYLPFSDKSVGMIVTSDQPIVAERVEYWGDGIGSAKYGASTKAGMTGAAKQFFFAYGSSTGATAANATSKAQLTNDESYVTVINPAPIVNGVPPADATVLVSFFGATGTPLGSKSITVSPQTRETVVVNNVIAPVAGPFYTVVSSDQPIFVEHPQYLGGSPNAGTHPGVSPSGSPAGLTSVLFPNVNTGTASGTPIVETVFLLNTSATDVTVNGTYYTPNGQTVTKAYTVPAGQIVVVDVNADAGNLPVGPLGAQYTTANGQFVAARISNDPAQTSYIGNQGVGNQ